MTQELSNFPGDIRSFTEVWGKATWDYVKAKVIFPHTQHVHALSAFLEEKKTILTESCPYL